MKKSFYFRFVVNIVNIYTNVVPYLRYITHESNFFVKVFLLKIWENFGEIPQFIWGQSGYFGTPLGISRPTGLETLFFGSAKSDSSIQKQIQVFVNNVISMLQKLNLFFLSFFCFLYLSRIL